jgi:hypothetical protein
MNDNDDLLGFLVEGLIAPQRDLVTRAFYKFAEGDPNSAPVNEAILLTACSRRLALAPKELREANAEFMAAVNASRQLERGMIERQERSHANVIASFKDETARANLALQVTVLDAKATVVKAQQIQEGMNPVITTTKEIGRDLLLLRDDLQKFDASVGRVERMAGNIQETHVTTAEMVKPLTTEIRANLLTTGLGVGMALEYALIESPIPNSGSFVLFAVCAGLIHEHFRRNWKFVRTLTEKFWSFFKTKPAR